MSAVKNSHASTVEDYLNGELISDVKHEFIEGYIYAMTGASANHERLSGNMYIENLVIILRTNLEPFGSDMKVKAASNFFYPDVIIDCDFDKSEPYFTDSPTIIVEVLSQSSRWGE